MPNGPAEIDPDQFSGRPHWVFNLAPKSAFVCTLLGAAAIADRLRAGTLWLKDLFAPWRRTDPRKLFRRIGSRRFAAAVGI